jgi:hypothetical protein
VCSVDGCVRAAQGLCAVALLVGRRYSDHLRYEIASLEARILMYQSEMIQDRNNYRMETEHLSQVRWPPGGCLAADWLRSFR